MTKKLLVIGCSFSVFEHHLGRLTWPKILSEKIDWHIYNTGIHGNSLQNQIYQLDYYLKNYKFDFIIFQATTSARDSFIIDEKEYIKNLPNFEQQSENYFINWFHHKAIRYNYNMTTPFPAKTDFEKKIQPSTRCVGDNYGKHGKLDIRNRSSMLFVWHNHSI